MLQVTITLNADGNLNVAAPPDMPKALTAALLGKAQEIVANAALQEAVSGHGSKIVLPNGPVPHPSGLRG